MAIKTIQSADLCVKAMAAVNHVISKISFTHQTAFKYFGICIYLEMCVSDTKPSHRQNWFKRIQIAMWVKSDLCPVCPNVIKNAFKWQM